MIDGLTECLRRCYWNLRLSIAHLPWWLVRSMVDFPYHLLRAVNIIVVFLLTPLQVLCYLKGNINQNLPRSIQTSYKSRLYTVMVVGQQKLSIDCPVWFLRKLRQIEGLRFNPRASIFFHLQCQGWKKVEKNIVRTGKNAPRRQQSWQRFRQQSPDNNHNNT